MDIMGLSLTLALVLGAGKFASADVPNRETLLQPYPNESWSDFDVRGYDTRKIAPGLYTFRYTGTRNIFMVTDEGVIATDPIEPEAAAIYRAEIAKVTDQPVKYVVYSHYHWDHIRGGQIFKDEGAEFIAHENCVPHLEARPRSDIVMPDITVSGDFTLTLGGRRLELLYFGPTHSDCMLYMRPDSGDYVFVVDAVTPGGVPGAFMSDNDIDGWLDGMRRLETLNVKAMIPGHGVPLAHISAVTERREYMEALIAATKEEMDATTDPVETAKNIRARMEPFAYMRNFDRDVDFHIRRIQIYHAIGW